VQKVDPELWDLVLASERAGRSRDAPIDVRVAFDGEVTALQDAGFPLYGPVPGVARGGLTPAQIRAVAKLPQVHSITLPADDPLVLDKSVPEIRANEAWGVGIGIANAARGRGESVVVGVIDSGIDVFHGAFRNSDGTSRILSLWDQTFDYDAPGNPVDGRGTALTGDKLPRDETGAVLTRTAARAPTRFNAAFKYGAEFNTAQINTALNAHPDGRGLPVSLRDEPKRAGGDVVFHGTHVAGIAAGNGAQNDHCTSPFTYVGVAPQADLIFVKTGIGTGGIQNQIDAAMYIFDAAAQVPGRACVINISLGGHNGPHNGFDDKARAFDTLTTALLAVGRAIVVAASNERNDDIHAAFTIPRGTMQTVRVNLTEDADRLRLFASYNKAATLTCIVRAPRSGAVQQTAAQAVNATNAEVNLGAHGVTVGRFVSAAGDPDSHFRVTIRKPAGGNVATGIWELDLAAGAGTDANVHLWIAEGAAAIVPFPGGAASAQDAGRAAANRRPEDWIRATLSTNAASRRVISVAAYNAEENGTPLAEFSSQGPAPNDLNQGLYNAASVIAKPDIAAPGVAVDAPRAEARKCCLECECCVDRYVAEQGTSMAAPHITGVVALMFAQDPTLTTDRVKEILRNTKRNPPALPPGWPPPEQLWGAGKVDAKSAVQAAVRERVSDVVTETPPMPVTAPTIIPERWTDRLRRWNQLLGPRPAWNLIAALVSMHFDEVKRLIDTNRRVAAVWQRAGGPAVVRGIVFSGAPPDPPLPAVEWMDRFLAVLARHGGEALRADVARHARLMQRLPGASWDELDAFVTSGGAA
jgi:subtilisin family serine protease